MIRHIAFSLLGMTLPDGRRHPDQLQLYRTEVAAEDTRASSRCTAALVPLMDATIGRDMLAALIDIAEGTISDPRRAARIAVEHAVATREYLGRVERDVAETARAYAAAVQGRREHLRRIDAAAGE